MLQWPDKSVREYAALLGWPKTVVDRVLKILKDDKMVRLKRGHNVLTPEGKKEALALVNE